MTDKHTKLLRALDRCTKNAQKIAYITENDPENQQEISSLYSYLVMWLPKMLVRYVPLMSDEDLCLLCRVPAPGHVTDLIRRAAREKTEHIDGIDGYEALELVRHRRWESWDQE